MLGRRWLTKKLSVKLLLMLALGLKSLEDLRTLRKIRKGMSRVDGGKGALTKKERRDPNVMEVDAAQVQDLDEKNTKDKQKTEGRCFLCNKQGHLKRQCPNNPKRSNSVRAV